MNDTAALRALTDAAWEAVAARPDKLSGRRVARPAFVPAEAVESESRFGSDFPVLAWLERALALAERSPLAALSQRFAALAPAVAWSQNPGYDSSNCEQSFLDGYAYAGLAGPEGPLLCAAPRSGFMLMGPDVTYPDHRHAPREVYLVLTPGTRWRLGRGEWFEVQPGDLLFHDAWQWHAMRTGSEPMLAFAGWVEPGRRQDIGWAGEDG